MSMDKKRNGLPTVAESDLPDAVRLVAELKALIDEARSAVAIAVNTGLTLLYWRIGKRINTEILKGNRAAYGKKILATVSQQLTEAYGQGFSYSSLTRMVSFWGQSYFLLLTRLIPGICHCFSYEFGFCARAGDPCGLRNCVQKSDIGGRKAEAGSPKSAGGRKKKPSRDAGLDL